MRNNEASRSTILNTSPSIHILPTTSLKPLEDSEDSKNDTKSQSAQAYDRELIAQSVASKVTKSSAAQASEAKGGSCLVVSLNYISMDVYIYLRIISKY